MASATNFSSSEVLHGYFPMDAGSSGLAGRIHRSHRHRLGTVAIVVGGLMFSFGEGGARRTLAGVIFGVGMAVGAVNFLSWLFP